MKSPDRQDHWLVRPASIRLMSLIGLGILGLTVLAQLMITIKGKFAVDGWFGFAAVFGFLVCLVMVLVAKGLGRFLKRKEDYYDA